MILWFVGSKTLEAYRGFHFCGQRIYRRSNNKKRDNCFARVSEFLFNGTTFLVQKYRVTLFPTVCEVIYL